MRPAFLYAIYGLQHSSLIFAENVGSAAIGMSPFCTLPLPLYKTSNWVLWRVIIIYTVYPHDISKRPPWITMKMHGLDHTLGLLWSILTNSHHSGLWPWKDVNVTTTRGKSLRWEICQSVTILKADQQKLQLEIQVSTARNVMKRPHVTFKRTRGNERNWRI